MGNLKEYLENSEEIQHNIQPFREKRVYIKDPSQAPSGANVQAGKRGGHYYDTDSVGSAGKEEPAKQDFLDNELDQKIAGEISSLAGTYAKEDEIYDTIEKKFGKDMAKLYKDDIMDEVKRVHAIDDPDVAAGYKPETSEKPAGGVNNLNDMGWDSHEDMLLDLIAHNGEIPDQIGEDYGIHIAGLLDKYSDFEDMDVTLFRLSDDPTNSGMVFDFKNEDGESEQITVSMSGEMTNQDGDSIRDERGNKLYVTDTDVYKDERIQPSQK